MSNISVQLIKSMGSDKGVAETARISFANDRYDLPDELNEKDESLIKFLARGITTKEYDDLLNQLTEGTGDRADAVRLYDSIRHQATHWTPFAHSSFQLKCSAPIPIRTQLFKHTVGLVANEESRRYISGSPEVFVPETFRAKPEGSIKQGSGIAMENQNDWINRSRGHYAKALALYDQAIDEGMCPEQARMLLPQAAVVNWVWTGNLVAFANVYNKRSDPHAQQEVQDFAQMLRHAIEPIMPVSWAALTRSQV